MWLLMPGLLVWPLWWSARRPARSIRFNGRFIISVRYLLSPSKGTRIGRSWCMEFSWQAGSLSSIFRVILSLWSVLPPWGISSKTGEATGQVAKWAIELGPHGLKYIPRTAIKSEALMDLMWISSTIGQSYRHLRRNQIIHIGLFILMGPDI